MLSALNRLIASIAFDSASRPLPLALMDGAHRQPNTSSIIAFYDHTDGVRSTRPALQTIDD